jgi:hypothetical protein
VVVHPADPGAPERRLAQTPAALEVVAILAVVAVLPEMAPDLLGAEKVPVMVPEAAEEAADDPQRASTRERGTVSEFVHWRGAQAQASLVRAATHGQENLDSRAVPRIESLTDEDFIRRRWLMRRVREIREFAIGIKMSLTHVSIEAT